MGQRRQFDVAEKSNKRIEAQARYLKFSISLRCSRGWRKKEIKVTEISRIWEMEGECQARHTVHSQARTGCTDEHGLRARWHFSLFI